MLSHRAKVISLVTHYKIPVISDRAIPTDEGGLITYGAFGEELALGAAAYIDRILKGAYLTQLPVQVPTKCELKVNPKTAKALDLAIPPSLLRRADEVIE